MRNAGPGQFAQVRPKTECAVDADQDLRAPVTSVAAGV
jgi:hypothetical protein